MRNVVKVKKLDPKAIIPAKGTEKSACHDVSVVEDIWLTPGQVYALHTGLSFEIVSDHYMEIAIRSGYAKKGLILLNPPGKIDNDYRGELVLLVYLLPVLWNCAILPDDNKGLHLIVGDRVAQCQLHEEVPCTFVEATELSPTKRGNGGLGHTGSRPQV